MSQTTTQVAPEQGSMRPERADSGCASIERKRVSEERRFLWLSGAFALMHCMAQALAASGHYHLIFGWLEVVLFASSVWAGSIIFVSSQYEEESMRGVRRITAWSGLATAGLLFICVFPAPSEDVLGSTDEGNYAATGIYAARHGSTRLQASILNQTPSFLRNWLLEKGAAEAQENPKGHRQFWQYQTGLILEEQDFTAADAEHVASRSTVVYPELAPGYAVWLAALDSTGGRFLTLRANLLLYLGSAILFALLLGRWLHPAAGWNGLILLLGCPLGVWVSRTFYAEPFVLCLWLMGLCAWACSNAEPLWGGVVAGLSFAVAAAAKLDGVFLGAIAGAVCLGEVKRRPRFVAGFLAGGSVAAAIWLATRQGVGLENWRETREALINAYGVFGLCAAGAMALGGGFLFGWLEKGRTLLVLQVSLIVLAVFALGYAAFIWPHTATPSRYYFWPYQAEIPTLREQTLVRLGWYLTPWGLGLGCAGALALLLKARAPWQRAFWLSAAGSFSLICFHLRIHPVQPYCMRRFMSGALLVVMAGLVAAPWLLPLGKRSRVIFTSGLTGLLVIAFIPIHLKLNNTCEYASLTKELENLAGQLRENDVVLVRAHSALADMATPLEFIFGRVCLPLKTQPNQALFERALTTAILQWKAQGRRTVFISEWPHDRLDTLALKCEPLFTTDIDYICRVQQPDHFPDETTRVTFHVTASALSAPQGRPGH